MSGVARLVAQIETEMGVEVEHGVETEAPAEAVGVNPEHLRMTEALLFAAGEPLDAKALSTSLPEGADLPALLACLELARDGRVEIRQMAPFEPVYIRDRAASPTEVSP